MRHAPFPAPAPWGDPTDVTAAGKSPPAPNVTAVAASPTSVSFGYEAGSYSYQYYAEQLYRGTLAYQYQTNSEGQARPTVTGLKPATTYRFAVRRTQGRQAESAAQFITVTTPPAAVRPPTSPDALTPTQRLDGENGYVIDLAWRDTTTPLWSGGLSSDPPDDFVVERAEVGAGGAYGPFAAVGTAGAATPFFTDAAALPEVEYAYRVRARNAAGLSVDRPENNAGARITLPRVGVFSDVPVAGERAGDPGQFVLERDGDLSGELPIKFDLVDLPAGHNATPADYDLSNTDDLKFAAGQRFAFLSVTAAVDGVPEFPEALAAALGASSAYEPADGQRPSTRATSGPAVVTIPDVPVDLDVDSDNSGEVDRSAEEDAIEDSGDAPGKYIAVNDGDSDHDGVVDFADGFTTTGGVAPGGTAGGEAFVPLKLELAEDVDLAAARVRFIYDASDPRTLTRGGAGTDADPYYYTPGSGKLRLWTRPGDEARSGEPAGAGGGDWVQSGGEYKLSDLRFDGRSGTLHVEAVAPGASTGDPRIKVELDPDGPDGPMPFAATDAVRMTSIAADIDIDSNNSDAFLSAGYAAFHSQAKDQIEDLEVNPAGKRLPGKVVLVNDGDLDGDGVPDYSDGFNADGIPSADDLPPPPATGYYFTPVSISIPAPIDLSKARLQIDYDASVPGAGAGGSLRLWTKDDDDQLGRNKNPFTTAGGNYVPKKSGSDYYSPADLAKLGLTDGARMKELFIEGIAASTQAGDKRIVIRVDPDGPGPAGFVAIDAVRLTTVRVDLDVNHNDSLDDPVDGTANYLPGYEGTTDKLSTGNTFNTIAYAGQETSLMVQGLGSGTVIDEINFTIDPDVTRLQGFSANTSDSRVEDYLIGEARIYRADDFSFQQEGDDRAQPGIMKDGKTTVPFWVKDYGGWAKVKVEAKVGENMFTLREFTVPNDTDGDKIADKYERTELQAWKTQYGLGSEFNLSNLSFYDGASNKELPDPDGSGPLVAQKTDGDNLSASEEYRGMILDGGGYDGSGSNGHNGGHTRLDFARKEVLVEVDLQAQLTPPPPGVNLTAILNGGSKIWSNATRGCGVYMYHLIDQTNLDIGRNAERISSNYSMENFLKENKNANLRRHFVHAIFGEYPPYFVADGGSGLGYSSIFSKDPDKNGSYIFVDTFDLKKDPVKYSTGGFSKAFAHEIMHLMYPPSLTGFDDAGHILDGDGDGNYLDPQTGRWINKDSGLTVPEDTGDYPALMYQLSRSQQYDPAQVYISKAVQAVMDVKNNSCVNPNMP